MSATVSQEYSGPDELWAEVKDADGTHSNWYKVSMEDRP